MIKNTFTLFFFLLSFVALGQSDELVQAYQNYQAYYQQGKVEEAIRWAKKALDLEVKEFGKEDLDHAATLNNLSTIYQNNQRYQEAIPLFREAAEIYLKKEGATSPAYATIISNLAVLYENQGELEQAAPLYKKTLAIRKKALGENSPAYLNAVANLAELFTKLAQYQEALLLYQELLPARKRNSGESSQPYATACINLASVYAQVDSFQLAETYFLEGLQAEEKRLGTQHIKYAYGLAKLAALYEVQGKYAAAEPFYKQSMEVFKARLGDQDTTYAASVLNLAGLYEALSNYEHAVHLYEEAVLILERQLGKRHPKYAEAINNKAGLYVETGEYAKAEIMYQEALTIYQKAYNDQDQHYTAVLNNLAILYEKMGKTQQASQLYQQVLRIYKGSKGENHTDYALVLNNLATLLKDQQEYAQAEQFYKAALSLKKKHLGAQHPEYAISLNNLAGLYKNMGKLDQAQPLYEQALAIKKRYLGEAHPEYAISLNNLAALYEERKAFEKAEPLYLQTLSIIKRHLGEKHPSFATTLNNMAVLYESMGKATQAESYYIQANQNLLYQIQYYFPYLNENSRKSFWDQNLQDGFAKFYHFAQARAQSNPQILGHVYDYRLATKALLLDGTAKMRNAILKSNDEELISRYNSWLTVKNSLAQAYTLSKQELTEYGWDVQALQREASRLETELSRQSKHFNHATRPQATTWRDIQRKLKPHEAAIEIIRVHAPQDANPIQYMAIIVKASQTAYPELVNLTNGKDLENKFMRYYRNCIAFQIEDELSYEKLWQPIANKLEGIEKVYFSADGLYNKINLATLWNPKKKAFLAQELAIHLVTNTKEITQWKKLQSPMTKHAVLLGHPTYNIAQDTELLAKGSSRSSSAIGRWFEQSSFADLPGTENEIIKIAEDLQQANWQLTIQLHEAATEEQVKQVNSPTVLHIATHGFFIPSEDDAKAAGHTTENPMLRSGLVLAGVENYYSSKVRPNTEDGILTAYEATTLFLDQTELVVLSACETGLGESQDGEGVYGLQRALKVAGAKTILMSLWKVDDEATQQLMANFYQNWLTLKDKRAAFQQAQTQLQKQFPEPYYWGAFVMVGE